MTTTTTLPAQALNFLPIMGSIFLMGAIFLTVGLFAFISIRHRKKVCTSKTTAKVIDIVKSRSRSRSHNMSRVRYYPVFSYDANGEAIQVQHNVSPTPYKIGDNFEILYNEEKPEQYYIEGKAGGSWLFNIVGVLFTLIGATMLTVVTIIYILSLY